MKLKKTPVGISRRPTGRGLLRHEVFMDSVFNHNGLYLQPHRATQYWHQEAVGFELRILKMQ